MSEQSNPGHKVKENIATYWNERSKTFDEDIGHGVDDYEKGLWKKYLIEIIGPAHKKILDVGTGTGTMALILAELGYSVTGIDIGGKMIETAQRKAERTGVLVTFQVGDAEEPDFPDNTFDCIICRHLLWTLPHLDTAIHEWSRICKAGGMIIAIDGHAKPHEYFQPLDSAHQKHMGKHQELCNQMYSEEIISKLPVNRDLTVDSLKALFSSLNLGEVQSQYIGEISLYLKNLMKLRGEESDHNEVQVIWGTVRK